MTAKGDKLYYQASFEDGFDLWEHDLKEDKTKVLLKDIGYGSLKADKENKHLFLCTNGGIRKIDVEKSETKPVEFEAVSITVLTRNAATSSSTCGSRCRRNSMWQTCTERIGKLSRGVPPFPPPYQQ